MNLRKNSIDNTGKKVHVELGCGNNRRDIEGWVNIGIDIEKGHLVDHICNLGFDDIPLDTSSVDLVQAVDVVEHIPKCAWIKNDEGRVDRLLPLVHLMNEIYRILKPNGEFYMEIPYGEWGYRRDPTHVTQLSDDWFHYFQPHDNLYWDQGIVKCNFKVKEHRLKGWKHLDDIMVSRVVAVK
jgi:predicted SAM-dependent methyltransferase